MLLIDYVLIQTNKIRKTNLCFKAIRFYHKNNNITFDNKPFHSNDIYIFILLSVFDLQKY